MMIKADTGQGVSQSLPINKVRVSKTQKPGNTPAKGVEGSGNMGMGMPRGAMAHSEGCGAKGKGHMGCK